MATWMTTKAAALGGAALLLAATLHPTGADADEIELRVLHYMSQTGNSAAMRGIFDDFEAENPGIRVTETITTAQGVVPEAQAAVAARRPFDVIQALNRTVIGAQEILNARPFSEAPDGGAFMANYAPNIRDAGKIGDEYYMAPHSFGTPLLYYNKDIMAAAGLDPEAPPTTFQEIAEASRQVVDETDFQGFYIITGGLDYGQQTMMMLAGSPYLDGNRAAFDTPEAVEVMQFWQDAVLAGLMPGVGENDGNNLFSAGQLAFMATTSARLQANMRAAEGSFELGIAQFPLWKDHERRVPNSGSGMMVTTQDPARIEASFKLLEFLSRPEISNRWSRESGYIPLTADPMADPVMAAFVEENPAYQVLIHQLSETYPTALWPGDRVVEAQTVVANLLSDLWQNRGTAEDLVPRAAAEVTRILEASTH